MALIALGLSSLRAVICRVLAKSPLYGAVSACVCELAQEQSVLQHGRVAALRAVQEHVQDAHAASTALQIRVDALFDRALSAVRPGGLQQALSAAA